MTSLPNSVTPVEHPDTVQDAAASPDKEMPYAELGLKPEEYADIKRLLGRRPTRRSPPRCVSTCWWVWVKTLVW